jgi:hypothetical protein
MRPIREQLLAGYTALREAGVDVSKAMAADGITRAEPTAQAAAQARLQTRSGDKAWFQKLMAGDAESTDEYQKLTQTLAG